MPVNAIHLFDLKSSYLSVSGQHWRRRWRQSGPSCRSERRRDDSRVGRRGERRVGGTVVQLGGGGGGRLIQVQVGQGVAAAH